MTTGHSRSQSMSTNWSTRNHTPRPIRITPATIPALPVLGGLHDGVGEPPGGGRAVLRRPAAGRARRCRCPAHRSWIAGGGAAGGVPQSGAGAAAGPHARRRTTGRRPSPVTPAASPVPEPPCAGAAPSPAAAAAPRSSSRCRRARRCRPRRWRAAPRRSGRATGRCRARPRGRPRRPRSHGPSGGGRAVQSQPSSGSRVMLPRLTLTSSSMRDVAAS